VAPTQSRVRAAAAGRLARRAAPGRLSRLDGPHARAFSRRRPAGPTAPATEVHPWTSTAPPSLDASRRIFRTEDELAAAAGLERIRYRLVTADRRFHANDNIADFVRDGELEELKAEVQAKLQEVLRALVIDTDSDHNTQETAKRVAKMYIEEVFRGPLPADALGHRVPQRRAAERADDRRARSPCAAPARHHMCPIIGKVWIGILPNEHSNLIGLSQVRAHLRLDHEPAADPGGGGDHAGQRAAGRACSPDGLAIVMEADHFCMHWRGVKDTESRDDQQRDARRLPEGRRTCGASSCRCCPTATGAESRCSSD
jgi:GTP cyclohydrolase I